MTASALRRWREVMGTIMLSLHNVPPDSGMTNCQLSSPVSARSDEEVTAPHDARDGVAGT